MSSTDPPVQPASGFAEPALAELALREMQGLAVLMLDAKGQVTLINRCLTELAGIELEGSRLAGRHWTQLEGIPPALQTQIHEALMLLGADGSPRNLLPLEVTHAAPLAERHLLWRLQILRAPNGASQLLCTGMDVTATQMQHASQRQALHDLKYQDPQTGLISLQAARERMQEMILRQQSFGLIAIKPHEFGLLGDNFGPSGVDEVLRAVAACLQSLVQAPGFVARGQGVEFCVVVPDVKEAHELHRLCRSMLTRFGRPLQLASTDLVVRISLGLACFPRHGGSLDELLRNAGTALNAAKRDGGQVQRVFDPRMQQRAREKLWLDHHLRKALELQQLELHYQPKVPLAGSGALSVEALLRWRHPKRGLIRPDMIVARAEDNGQISAIGRWVIVSAATQAAQWLSQGLKVRIAINISARQFADPDLLRWLSECQRVAQGLLDVELTESSVIADEAGTQAFMHECHILGCKVFLDDFGTGFSSLSQLARLPIDVIKLDRSFLQPGAAAGRSQSLMRSIVSVAKDLKLEVIAEGVETEVQAEFLRGIGVDGAQGWLYAAAMPSAEYAVWAKAYQQHGP
ncbi:MAG: EAL domain-containing protein [Burkholderiaceae bacterium]|nr:EAL domain-containing protein [Burkholderiaceae bacterium]